MRLSHLFGATVLATASLGAQVLPGQHIASVIQNGTGELYILDTGTQKATQLTLSSPVETNCVMMMSPATGFVGTNTAPAEIYSIVVSGTNCTVKPLFKNQQALTNQANISQITRVGTTLYFVTNDSATTNDATVWSVPLAGGVDPTQVVDLSTVTGYPANGLANAIASDGKNKIWVAIWTAGEVFEYDLTTKTAALWTTLPSTKGTATGFYPVNMHYRNGKLECFGLYGDVAIVDATTKNVDAHYWQARPTATNFQALINSGYWNEDQGHYNFGSRDGALDALVPQGNGQLAPRILEGVGAATTASQNSVTGLYYTSAGGNNTYSAFAAGCAGSGGFFPTSTGLGLPGKQNKNWAFGLNGTALGTNVAIFLIGAGQTQIDLTGLGLPGCQLLTLPIIVLPVATSNAVANGFGSAMIPIPIGGPITIDTQWIVWDTANSKFDAASDGRRLTVK